MIEKEPKKRTAWALLLFYFLIGFEILFMISPFGLYYYSVYGEGLNFLNDYAVTAWLCTFFLPHIAETSSPILNATKIVGWTLAVLGFLGFCAAAIPVYYRKLAKKGAVTGGIYKHIRHPQYLSLIICSLGLLLVWPRNIVMISFVTVIFAYYFLAKAEEKECIAKFGKPYEDYVRRTGMFLPFDYRIGKRMPNLPRSGVKRYVSILCCYAVALLIAVSLTHCLRIWSARSLHSHYEDDTAVVSLTRIDEPTMDKVITLTISHPLVNQQIQAEKRTPPARFLIYVMPAEWFMSDLPMNMKGHRGHHEPKEWNRDLYKILVMRAFGVEDDHARNEDLLLAIRHRKPLVELTLNIREERLLAVEKPPPTVRWGNIPTPLF
jgi:protein-S-isoprenylcysteine O-methyltransferase Ste14